MNKITFEDVATNWTRNGRGGPQRLGQWFINTYVQLPNPEIFYTDDETLVWCYIYGWCARHG